MSKNEHGKGVGGERLHLWQRKQPVERPAGQGAPQTPEPSGGPVASGAGRPERGRSGWVVTRTR